VLIPVAMVLVAARKMEAGFVGDGFKQRRFAAAVLTYQERDGCAEGEVDAAGKYRQRSWKLLGVHTIFDGINPAEEDAHYLFITLKRMSAEKLTAHVKAAG